MEFRDTKIKRVEQFITYRVVFDKHPVVRKETEFLAAAYLVYSLKNILVFRHQEKMLNYRLDMYLELRDKSRGDILSIVVEIDENCHSDRNSKDEFHREGLIKAFGYRLIRISIKRGLSEKKIIKVVAEYIARHERTILRSYDAFHW